MSSPDADGSDSRFRFEDSRPPENEPSDPAHDANPVEGEQDPGEEVPSKAERSVTLSEGAEAVKGTLEGCCAELDRLQQQLRGAGPEGGGLRRAPEETGSQSNDEAPPSPRERALYVASRLEACAGALRKAGHPGDE